jgi:Leucine-rich repeat (LRR) protein
MVDRELIRAWTSFDPDEYGQTVLDGHAIRHLKVTDPTLLPVLHYPRIKSLELFFRRGYGDIHDLARLADIERLEISDTLLTDISPLAEMTALTHLELYVTGIDLEDDTIAMHLAASRARLRRFGLWRARRVRNLDNLINVPALDSVDFLVLSDAVNLTSIAGIEKWAPTLTGIVLAAPSLKDAARLAALPHLKFINLSTTPIRDIAFMAQLSELWVLHIGYREALPDLSPLRHLNNLNYLYLHGRGTVDLRPLAGNEDLEVNIADLKERRVLGSDNLGKGSTVVEY